MDKYLWAVNPAKVIRAEKELKQKGLPVINEAVKELYIKFGGKVLTEEEVDEVIAIKAEEELEAQKPKRRNVK